MVCDRVLYSIVIASVSSSVSESVESVDHRALCGTNVHICIERERERESDLIVLTL